MRKLILIYVFCSFCGPLLGQSFRTQQSPNTGNQNIFVNSKRNATLYKLPAWENINSLNKEMKDQKLATYRDIYILPKKTLRKPTELKVIAYTNVKHQIIYLDTYIVLLNNSLYYIESLDIADNTPINEQNNSIDINYNALKTQVEILKSKIDSLRHTSLRQCQDSIDYYKRLKTILPAQIDSVENVAIAEYKQLRQEKFNKWYNNQPSSTKQAANRLQINYAKLQGPNSAGGCDYEFYYTNVSNKTIKYLHWTGTVYNAVGDLAHCTIRHYSTYTGRDTGPVKPDTQGGGTWNCIVYNYSADTVKLNNIKIEYMDGTSATISSTDIRRLIDAPAQVDGLYKYGDSFTKQQKASKPYRDKLEACDNIIRKWQNRKNRLNEEFYYLYNDSEYNIYSRLKVLNEDYKIALTDLWQFERDNFIK